MKMRAVALLMVLIIAISVTGCSAAGVNIEPDISPGFSNIDKTENLDNSEGAMHSNSGEYSNPIIEDAKITVPDLPEDFLDCTKYIGQDVSGLGIDGEFEAYERLRDVGESLLFGNSGSVTIHLGWDGVKVTDITLITEYIQGNEYEEISNKLESIFGERRHVTDGITDFYGDGECAFRLTRHGAGIGWTGINKEQYQKLKPQKEETPKPEPIKIPPSVGMTTKEVLNSTWGEPSDKTKTTTKYGVSEQWIYRSYDKTRYIFFEDGFVTTIVE